MIDTHCHLADSAFLDDLDGVVARARAAGVNRALCILSADEPVELARAAGVGLAWPGVFFAAGIHPHRSGAYAERAAEIAGVVNGALDQSGAVAVGEIGLDYHYDPAPRPVQRAVFRAQVEVALERDLPIVVHTREAMADTLAVLREAGPRLRVVLHCFTGSVEEADAAVALGAYISVSGISTFPKATALRDVAARVPSERLFIETDSPYLAPVPHRGHRNEPGWIAETYAAIAEVRSVTRETLSALVHDNFHRFLNSSAQPASR